MDETLHIERGCTHKNTVLCTTRNSVHVGIDNQTACEECISVAVSVFEASLRDELITQGFRCPRWEEKEYPKVAKQIKAWLESGKPVDVAPPKPPQPAPLAPSPGIDGESSHCKVETENCPTCGSGQRDPRRALSTDSKRLDLCGDSWHLGRSDQ